MEEPAQSRGQVVLLLVVLKEEVADSMLISIPKFMVHERFGEDRLAAARIGRDPEQVIMGLCIPLKILGMRQHPSTSTIYPIGIDVLELFVCAYFECAMTLPVLII